MVNIIPDQLSDCLNNILEDYNREILDGSIKEVDRTTSKIVKRSKADAPKKTIKDRTAGTYARHISSKVNHKSMTGYSKVWYVRAPEYPLTHLLNNGHALHQGGRWEGTGFLTRIAEDETKTFERKIQEVIRNASR